MKLNDLRELALSLPYVVPGNEGGRALNGYRAARPTDLRPQDWEKFFGYIEEDAGCWIWTGTMQRGRPTFRYLGRRISPARMLLVLQKSIEYNDTVLADCDDKRCIKHVKVFTPVQYARRMSQIVTNDEEKVF